MPPRARRKPAAGMPAAPPAEERDYLVIYEEPDPYGLPADDTLVLDIQQPTQTRPEVDVQQKVTFELTNTTSRLGTFGFGVTCCGAVVAVLLMALFAAYYPDQWNDSAGTRRTVLFLSVLTIMLLVGGTVLTHYGRRIQARGRLSDVRIVEKTAQNKARLE
ncbi:MAG: hypothetical protein ABR562_05795 [Thermoplasmatota archaeon]